MIVLYTVYAINANQSLSDSSLNITFLVHVCER